MWSGGHQDPCDVFVGRMRSARRICWRASCQCSLLYTSRKIGAQNVQWKAFGVDDKSREGHVRAEPFNNFLTSHSSSACKWLSLERTGQELRDVSSSVWILRQDQPKPQASYSKRSQDGSLRRDCMVGCAHSRPCADFRRPHHCPGTHGAARIPVKSQ